MSTLYRDKILYGRDSEENIVAVDKHGEDTVMVYTRVDDPDRGSIIKKREEKVYPFMWLSDDGYSVLQEEVQPTLYKHSELRGDLFYRHLIACDNGTDYRSIYSAMSGQSKQTGEKVGAHDRYVHRIGNMASQYLAQTGKTLFKGLTPQKIRRMQVDIEVYSSTDGFPNAKRPDDEIIIISLCDNHGWECVLHTSEKLKNLPAPYRYCPSEKWMLVDFVKLIHRRDPDVLELHNGFGFDLPYLRDRAVMHGVNFALGRNGSVPNTRMSSKRFAERDMEYERFEISGRHVIDTMFLAADYDVYKRDLPSLKLKEVAVYLGCAADERVYVAGERISQVWDADPKRLLEYALHDVYETRGISDNLSASTFYLTQITPMTYQSVHCSGTSSIIESLFTREYIRQRHSIPLPENEQQQHGGYTDIFQRGVYHNCVYADVASLYPSIMLNGGWEGAEPVCPESDKLRLFPYFLKRLTDLRFESKNKLRTFAKGSAEYQETDARQSAYKTLINSFYGVCGFPYALFNDISEADRVALTGQKCLKRMLTVGTRLGATAILCDTDGVLFQLPEGLERDEEVDSFVAAISAEMPPGINIDNDGRFSRVLSYRKKNYILEEYDTGKIKVKGGSFKSRGVEGFGRQYVHEVAMALLDRDPVKVAQIHSDYRKMILGRTWSVDDFKKRGTLRKTLEEYEKDLAENRNCNRMAPYELAKRLRDVYGEAVYAGDTLYYYIAGDKPKSRVRSFEDAKLVSEWVPNDENIRWYHDDRLKKLAAKFEDFFTPEDFGTIFDLKNTPLNIKEHEAALSGINVLNTTLKHHPDDD